MDGDVDSKTKSLTNLSVIEFIGLVSWFNAAEYAQTKPEARSDSTTSETSPLSESSSFHFLSSGHKTPLRLNHVTLSLPLQSLTSDSVSGGANGQNSGWISCGGGT